MTEAFNVDDWLADLKKPRYPVKIYQRPDLAGQIALLEQKLKELGPPDEESLGGGERADLNAEIDELAQQFHDSAVTFWVQSLGPEQVDEIGEKVRKDLKAKIDEVSTQARKDARDNAKRLGVESPTEINRMVKESVQSQVNMTVGFEISLHLLSEAIDEPKISPEQLRTIAETLGEGQISKLRDAFNQISKGSPEGLVPKSSRSGTTGEDEAL